MDASGYRKQVLLNSKLREMKSVFILIAGLISIQSLYAQPPGRPEQPRHTIPKETILKPDKSNIKLFSFEQILGDVPWHGTRIWQTDNGVTVDSITSFSFFLTSKQTTWTKRGWEYATSKPGSYTVTNNRIAIQLSYYPYTHYLEGTYDAATKKITGTFTEERVAIRNAPSAYKAGTTTGTFEIVQK